MTKQNKEKFLKVTKKAQYKLYVGSWIFFSLSILGIFISTLIIILNLYAIRWNERPYDTMYIFVHIAIVSAFTTFFLSVQAFLNISKRKQELSQNISKIDEIIELISTKEQLNQEDIDNISEVIN
ncbi:hypothetical protein [Mycoplasmopsis cynos]|uniref:DUF4231 domain-containing protein n=2 Tax=Mycoplasmopsis cynos TaxID=171284 RepID=L0RV92_MYCC1|nr:hypothetical protein [Mycoplasmopsis cynos]MCU9934949.1 hypothetical protein [Mycoplasmopsis cynos]TQC54484.1 hypothetical protein E1I74_03085 [Mycoplasmopsis cynos]UWV80840.1 hypothetical protein NW069_01575 [Mycoplasmopsis cynos]UWV81915.1 hypothetical protein NW065_02195 [Mycoplasmopsis cynos]UWV83130.1 hypothetical protein NW067_02555 [Mycoplasmopsis cynos]